jgi:cyclomaltodextrinase
MQKGVLIMKPKAKKVSQGVKRAVFYQIFLRAFTREGTIAAATKMLPEIADLGVTHVYLCPIAESDDDMNPQFWSDRQKQSGFKNPKNPYRIKDYFKIDSEYGTDEDLLEFVNRAHSLGLKVLLDLVFIHCGPTAVFLSGHPDFIMRESDGTPHCLSWHFPGLNFDNLELREYLWSNMTYFVEKFDVDGYRCDVGDGIPLDFWIEGRKRIEKIKPNIVMLNEGVKGEALLEAFDINYNFDFRIALCDALQNTVGADTVRENCEKVKAEYPENGRCIRCMDNHDTASDSYENRFEIALGPGGIEAGFAVIFTLDGVPMIYNGNEACDDSRHSIVSNRYFGGLHVKWENALTEKGAKRRKLLKQLAEIHKNEPAIYDGDICWLENSNPQRILSYMRSYEDEKIIVLVNTDAKKQTVEIECNAALQKELLSFGTQLEFKNGKINADFEHKGYIIFKAE